MYYSSLSCTVCQHVSISHHAYDEGVRFTAGMTKLISYLPLHKNLNTHWTRWFLTWNFPWKLNEPGLAF
jgi:hypothetical protein